LPILKPVVRRSAIPAAWVSLEGRRAVRDSGRAGPRRFSLPVSVGRLLVEDDQASVELIEMEPKGR